MVVKTTLEKPAPPTDKTILGKYWMFADTEDLEKTVRYIQFELDERHRREENSQRLLEVSAERRAEVAAILDDLEAEVELALGSGDPDGES